ncbi:MAG: LysR substrate-binding domain-containing protein [Aeromonas sp.]
MELKDLTAFVTLAEVRHFGHAAARLHVTQSALSKQIKRLELSLGAELFVRTRRQTELTPFGRALYGPSLALVEQGQSLKRLASAVLSGQEGVLRIGFGVATHDLVPRALSAFRQTYPQVRVELSDLSTHHQLLALEEGRLDLGFCRLPAPNGWHAIPVSQGHFVAVYPAALGDIETISALAPLPLAVLKREQAPSFYDQLLSFLAACERRALAEQAQGFIYTGAVNDFAAGIALAAAGLAWTLVPSALPINQAGVRSLALHDAGASWRIGLVHAPKPSLSDPLIRAFSAQVLALSPPRDAP